MHKMPFSSQTKFREVDMKTQIKKNFCILMIVLALIFSSVALFSLFSLQQNSYSYVVNYINNQDSSQDIALDSAVSASIDNKSIEYKLFGIIPIGSQSKSNNIQKYVSLGGYPLGIDIKVDGMYITSKVSVVTKEGAVCPVEDIDIKAGDMLIAINGEKIYDAKQISELIKDKENIEITIKRNGELKNFNITPALDVLSNEKKLGLMLQDGIEGIGTMTYTDGENFYALGHTIKDMNGEDIKAREGKIFDANIIGYAKGQKGKAGELNGSFSTMDNPLGEITANNNYGLYGKLNNTIDENKVLLGSKDDAKPGAAYIYTTIDGDTPQKYEIQIIKVSKQSSPQEKSMVLRIVDKRLLDTTGGIVQGMSGSPIVQDGKLIGAVTHVFVSDPTKGYGVFIDWMKP